MKKTLLFRVDGGRQWIGGLYYCKNILYSVAQNQDLLEKYRIHIYVSKENREIFSEFEKQMRLSILPENKKLQNLLLLCKTLWPGTAYVYYVLSAKYDKLIGKKSIYWIPDFQYLHYPQYFTEEDKREKNGKYEVIAQSKGKLVLSSQDCLKDFLSLHPDCKIKCAVVPFVSYIEKELREIDTKIESDILKKYGLHKGNYLYIPNQFWQHKNHVVVLKAMKELKHMGELEKFRFVFTGEMLDDRNPSYIKEIKKYMEDPEIADHILNLGFLGRREQLVIMKNAKMLIQPSLFEGWGTVLEDAKVLDKLVVLSDIPVHREQMNENCMLFRPTDKRSLAETILEMSKRTHEDHLEQGLANMKERAFEYGKKLASLLLHD